MKYRLTITQITNKTYGDQTYDDRASVVYEAENLGDLLFIIRTSESIKPVNVEYKIEKVVEK